MEIFIKIFCALVASHYNNDRIVSGNRPNDLAPAHIVNSCRSCLCHTRICSENYEIVCEIDLYDRFSYNISVLCRNVDIVAGGKRVLIAVIGSRYLYKLKRTDIARNGCLSDVEARLTKLTYKLVLRFDIVFGYDFDYFVMCFMSEFLFE